MCIKKLNIKNMIKYIISVIVLAVIYDFLVINEIINFYFYVSSDYCSEIFGGIVTLSVLSNAILSSVIGISKENYYGYYLNEILAFDNSPIKISNILYFTISMLILSIPAFAFSACTTLTIILIVLCAYTINVSCELWDFFCDDERKFKLIKENIYKQFEFKNIKNLSDKISFWGLSLNTAIKDDNDVLIKKYVAFLHTTLVTCSENKELIYVNQIQKIFKYSFENALKVKGIADAFDILFKNDSQLYDTIDIDDCFKYFLQKVVYYDTTQLLELNLLKIAEDVKYNLELDDSKLYLATRTLYSLGKTLIATKDSISCLFEEYLKELCYFRRTAKNSEVQSVALQLLYRDFVLLNENYEKGKYIYNLILNNLVKQNLYNDDEIFIKTISDMFFGTFNVIQYETETLTQEHLNKIKALIKYNFKSKNTMQISFSRLLKPNKMVRFYVKDIFENNTIGSLYDYFPCSYYCKNVLYSNQDKIIFAFLFFYVTEKYRSIFPVEDYFKHSNIDIKHKISFCETILNLFNETGESLKESSINYVRNIEDFINDSTIIYKLIPLVENFKYFNNKLLEFKQTNTYSVPNTNVVNIENNFKELLEKEKFIELDNNINLKNEKTFTFTEQVTRVDSNSDHYTACSLLYLIKDIINYDINKNLKPVTISFDMDGVHSLLSELEQTEYKFCNYIFVNDLSLEKEVLESQDYEKLCDEIDKIENKYLSYTGINHHIFLKTDKIKINISFIDSHPEIPSEEQCYDYINNFKVADGKFKIENILFDTNNAINYVKEHYQIIKTQFKVKTNITPDSGFRTKIDYKLK